MPYNESNPLESLDAETGMLTDIDAIRELGLRIARLAKSLLVLPTTAMLFDRGTVLDMAVAIVNTESLLHVMSQAGYYRRLGELLGADPWQVEGSIHLLGLSEVLPWTHPDAPVPTQETQINPNDPRVRQSVVLQQIVQAQAEQVQAEPKPQEPPIELPPSIDEFLKSLGQTRPESE